MQEIIISGAKENNLKNISVNIPHYCLTVVTGVSGSGKSSLVYDVIAREGQRLFFENFVSGRHHNIGKFSRPHAETIEGLFPVVVVSQNNVVRSSRSTVGTLTELYDYLRLLFARLGKSETEEIRLSRSLFSFNLPDGWCPACKGIGLEDRIDPELIIDDASKSLREGAMVLTTPNNYIIYSQVTMDVLNQICESEGFSVDVPWQDLTEEQKNVVLYGSSKIKILFGKHPLESRLRWTGITAKPREEGFYKGIIPVMEEILRRERNPNIMRFTRSCTCPVCERKKLNSAALSVKLWGLDIDHFAQMSISKLHEYFKGLKTTDNEAAVVGSVRESLLHRTHLLMELGLGHLSLKRESGSLSGGEGQRIKLAIQAASGLRNILYILDEPSAGLHASEQQKLLGVLRALVNTGNTVVAVEHDEQTIREADFIIDIGPGAGVKGGEIVFSGSSSDFFKSDIRKSITLQYLLQKRPEPLADNSYEENKFFFAENALKNNLNGFTARFMIGGFNVITGVSGSGKTSLVNFLLEKLIPAKAGGTDIFKKIIHIDASPIGRTPKSNPATYTRLSDHVRDLLASLPESKEKGFKKGQFSFVVKGGRCEACGGAGVQQIGMHFLGQVQMLCEECEGKRFTQETLAIRYKGLNIFDILELTVDEADVFFRENKKISAITSVLSELGLGYLKLGQPSTTLSGGEAQRVKLASELSRSATGTTLYILDEPTTGLHMADVETLLAALKKLAKNGHTLIYIEHDPAFILSADYITDLGPGSGTAGGSIVAEGTPREVYHHQLSATSKALREHCFPSQENVREKEIATGETINSPIRLFGAATNNLKNIDVSFPLNSITAVTGISGSGKSSLAYGTLFAECNRRFLEGMSSQLRLHNVIPGQPVLSGSSGLTPSIAVLKKNAVNNPRSTIATYTGLYDHFRLLYSRLSESENGTQRPLSTAFSFNHEEGACHNCRGIGELTVADPDKLISHPDLPIIDGAMNGSKTGRFYGDPFGQYVATLQTAALKYDVVLASAWSQLSDKEKSLAMYGCGDEVFNVDWHYKRGTREGTHKLKTKWPGFVNLVNEEYTRKHADYRGEAMLALMKKSVCDICFGMRLKEGSLQFRLHGLNIGELTALSAEESYEWFGETYQKRFRDKPEAMAAFVFSEAIRNRLNALILAGLGYITTDRQVGSLSGGEFQRLRLAGLVRAPLTGVTYILDEPSFGLHPKDTDLIASLIENLRGHGNTIVMVDHSPIMLEKADYTIVLGPGAGDAGGEIISELPVGAVVVELNPVSSKAIRTNTPPAFISVEGAFANNLKNISVDFHARALTVISGVSGSGKTSLIDRVLWPSYGQNRPVCCKAIKGMDQFTDIIYVEQAAPSFGSKSSVASWMGFTDLTAKLFSATDAAKSRGFKSMHFSPHSSAGQCPICEGEGEIITSMDFFSNVSSACESCGGTGLRGGVCDILIDGFSVWDILQLPMEKFAKFLSAHLPHNSWAKVSGLFKLLSKVGIGHISPARRLKTLSTGELQRLKLIKGIASAPEKGTLFMLDEPSGGLHPTDILKFITLFNDLIEKENTILCVSHDRLIRAASHYELELGPGGGSKGGEILQYSKDNFG